MKYIAAFNIGTRGCDCGTLIDEIIPVEHPETIEDCTEADKKAGILSGWREPSQYVKQSYKISEKEVRYLTFDKREMILVLMPPGLAELLEYLPDLKALRANADGLQKAVNWAHHPSTLGGNFP